MKINQLQIYRFPPFVGNNQGQKILFSKNINIIRGENGGGKTTIGELISLIGHMSCIEKEYVKYTNHSDFETEYNPREFVVFNLEFSAPDLDFLKSKQYTKWKESTFEIILYTSNHIENLHLKKILKSDSLISKHISIAVRAGDEDNLIAAKYICNFNRPSQVQTPKYSKEITDNSVLLTAELKSLIIDRIQTAEDEVELEEIFSSLEGSLSNNYHFLPSNRVHDIRSGINEGKDWDELALPGLVSYINTDMYERGVGNDLRESPKDIEAELEDVFDKRFNIFTQPNSSGHQKIFYENEIDKAWKKIIQQNENLEQCIWVQIRIGEDKIKHGLIKVDDIRFSNDGGDERAADRIKRDFVSSGENQVIFFLIMLKSLVMKNSIIIADEPELHLGFEIKWRFLNWFIDFMDKNDNQVFIITHESLTLRNHLNHSKNDNHNGLDVSLIFVKRTPENGRVICQGNEALAAIGESSRHDLEFLRSQLSCSHEEIKVDLASLIKVWGA